MNDLIEVIEHTRQEMIDEGMKGWPNVLSLAIERIEALEQENTELREELAPYHQDGAERVNAVLAEVPYMALLKKIEALERERDEARAIISGLRNREAPTPAATEEKGAAKFKCWSCRDTGWLNEVDRCPHCDAATEEQE